MTKEEKMYELMKIFKPYYDEKGYGLKKGAPKEAVDAYNKFNDLLDSMGKLPPVEDKR